MTHKNWGPFWEFMVDVFDGIGYAPSEEQWKIHRSVASLRQVVGGERAGKSYAMSMDCAVRILYAIVVGGIGDGVYWIVGPDYNQPRQEFGYVVEALRAAGVEIGDGMLSMPKGEASPWICEVPGLFRLQTKTGADVAKIASTALHGAMYSEAAQGTYDIVLKLQGRVLETAGWILIGGTLEAGLPWYGEKYKEWQVYPNEMDAESFSMPTWSNLAKFPGGREDPKIKKLEASYTEDRFLERFAAIPRKIRT